VSEQASPNANAVAEQVRSWNSRAVTSVVEYRGETTLVVPPELLRETALFCRDSLQFNMLSDTTCVDRYPTEPRFEMNYQLTSIPKRARLRLRTTLGGQNPVVDSLMPVWPGANWLEREVFDLFGIHFEGHTDLRRILLPDEFKGAPLRRDFPVWGER